MTPIMNEEDPNVEPLFTTAEVATMARVSPRTVSRWAHSGLLDSVPMPGGWRFRESVVKALLTQGASR